MPPRIRPSVPSSGFPPSPYTHCQSCLRRSLSSTPQSHAPASALQTKLRKKMFAWLHGPGREMKQPSKKHQTTYLGSYVSQTDYAVRVTENEPKPSDRKQVFPQNPEFYSESVLSEALRLEVWKRIQVEKQSVRQVSADFGIDMRRVGAVVRLVEVEKRMRAEGKPLALPYAEAIHSMVPVTHFSPNNIRPPPHESINDLPHHPLTAPQIFYPTSESRAFNRTDAGRVFSAAPRLPDSEDIGQGGSPLRESWQDTELEIIGKRGQEMPVLKPADARIPHAHLIRHEADKLDPLLNDRDVAQRYEERLKVDEELREKMFQERQDKLEKARMRVESNRWEFVVQDVRAGSDGVGQRYGIPSQDRKRGNVRIPTRVEV